MKSSPARLALSLTLALLLPSVAAAQPAPLQGATPPALFVAGDGPAQRLGVKRVHIASRIIGHLAETQMTLTFGNPHDRPLAGDLYVPLPPTAKVSAYALDIEGRMVDGVVVPKDEARRIFEAEVRKGVDPGLVEWTRGNVFKTRVFPIPARGTRTVRIAWVAPLESRGGDAVYHLPLSFTEPLEEGSVRIEVISDGPTPQLEQRGPLRLSFSPRLVAEASVRGRPLVDALRVVLPRGAEAGSAPLYERSPHSEGALFFSARREHRPPADLPRLSPRRLGVFWDASLSRKDADHAREIGLLMTYLRTLGVAEVELTVFRNEADTPRRFPLPARLDALEGHLRGLLYDGGTQLGTLSPATGPTWAEANLIFTDGISTFGAETVAPLGAPTWFISSDRVTATAGLMQLAAESGGAYLDLASMADSDALDALGRPTWSLLEVKVMSGKVEDLLPSGPTPALGPVHLAGRLTSSAATLRLRWGIAGRVHAEETLTLTAPTAPAEGEVLRFDWARARLQNLMAAPERNASEMVALGRAHGIVTPGTSLLVLETLEQYLTWDVEPPASWQEMHARWHTARKGRLEVAARDERAHLERVAEAWRQELAWYETDFKPKPLQAVKDARARGSRAPVPLGAMGAGGMMDELAESDPDGVPEGRPSAAKKKDSAAESSGTGAEIVLAPWNPDVPWVRALRDAPKDRWDEVYLARRAIDGAAPSFYLDCAEFFFERKDTRRGLRVLSNLAELRLDDPPLLRVLGHRLSQLDRLDLAAQVFEQVLRLRPEEPQSYRDLALVLGRRALEQRSGAEDLRRALALLADVVKRAWDRFDGIEIIALHEYNRLVAKNPRLNIGQLPLDDRFLGSMPLDVRITMSWDADLTDMDLHVVEPTGEEAFYGLNLTGIGGRVSRDFTQGYGPETYSLRKAPKGTYQVKTKYFGSSAAQLTGAVTLQVDVVTDWGRPSETRRSMTLRLTEAKETFVVGEITL